MSLAAPAPPLRKQPVPSSRRPQMTVLALLCFAVGLTHTIKINIIGEAALAEMLLPLLALVALGAPAGTAVWRTRPFRWLLLSLLVTLAGYVISDLYQGSAAEQFLRGWGRILLVISDFICLSLIAGAQRQTLWWFAAGMGIGRALYLRFGLGTSITMWKFSADGYGYAEPVTLMVATAAVFLPPRLASALLVLVGLLSIHYDFRIQSAVCIMVAGVIWIRARRPAQPLKQGGGLRLAVMGAFAATLIYAGLQLTADDYSAQRRGVSDIGRSLGKVFAMKAIAESPLVGYGSWSRSRKFVQLQQEALREVAGERASEYAIGDSSSATHSMVLQAWVEGGILGTAFFVTLGVLLARQLPALALRRPLDSLTPVLLYFGLYGLWHIVMSAFAAPLRIQLAFAGVVLVCLALDAEMQRQDAKARIPRGSIVRGQTGRLTT